MIQNQQIVYVRVYVYVEVYDTPMHIVHHVNKQGRRNNSYIHFAIPKLFPYVCNTYMWHLRAQTDDSECSGI